jgi:predicted RNA-binding protein with PUA-like domain
MAATRSDWLVKTEPDCFSIQDLANCPKQTTAWSGVRNYQARNFMRDMQLGDRVLFYHSSASPPVVAGTAVVARTAYPDPTAWDPKDDHFDAKASPENPIWLMVDIRLDKIFAESVPIARLRDEPALLGMELLRTGSRLSVQPVKPREFEIVMQLAGGPRAAKFAAVKKAKPARATSVKKNEATKKTKATKKSTRSK